jgi:8-oxo-dGTP pyrophosphatase MutT (NUDIX family)
MRKTLPSEKHFCASVWIITKANPRKILLLHHKKFDRWMQPGGHIEQFENPVEGAIREVAEETGVDISFLLNGIEKIDEEGKFLPVPQFLMEQSIPAHKGEPAHFHIDIQYVVKIGEQTVSGNNESHGIKWFSKEEALKLSIHEDTKRVIEKLL